MSSDLYKTLLEAQEVTAPVLLPGVAWLADGRRVRVPGAVPGWYRLAIKGREARVIRPAEDEEAAIAMWKAEPTSGHVVRLSGEWLVSGTRASRYLYLVREEPLQLSHVRAVSWGGTDTFLIWHSAEWESEEVEHARRALDAGNGLQGVKCISLDLRRAFALAMVEKVRRDVEVSAAELSPYLRGIAEHGEEEAARALHLILDAQVMARPAPPTPPRRAPPAVVRPSSPEALVSLETQLVRALEGTGALLLTSRRLGVDLVEVRWRMEGERFVSVVELNGFRVRDAGVCLSGGDRVLTLHSLPGVVREAIDTDVLYITRRWYE